MQIEEFSEDSDVNAYMWFNGQDYLVVIGSHLLGDEELEPVIAHELVHVYEQVLQSTGHPLGGELGAYSIQWVLSSVKKYCHNVLPDGWQAIPKVNTEGNTWRLLRARMGRKKQVKTLATGTAAVTAPQPRVQHNSTGRSDQSGDLDSAINARILLTVSNFLDRKSAQKPDLHEPVWYNNWSEDAFQYVYTDLWEKPQKKCVAYSRLLTHPSIYSDMWTELDKLGKSTPEAWCTRLRSAMRDVNAQLLLTATKMLGLDPMTLAGLELQMPKPGEERDIPKLIYGMPTAGKTTLQYLALRRTRVIYDTDSFLFRTIEKDTDLGRILYDQSHPDRPMLERLARDYAMALYHCETSLVSNLMLDIIPNHCFLVDPTTEHARYVARRKRDNKATDDLEQINFQDWFNGAVKKLFSWVVSAKDQGKALPKYAILKDDVFLADYYYPDEARIELNGAQRETILDRIDSILVKRGIKNA